MTRYTRNTKKSPKPNVAQNQMAWAKMSKLIRASGGSVNHDQLVAVLRGDSRIKPDQMIAYCVRMGWLEEHEE